MPSPRSQLSCSTTSQLPPDIDVSGGRGRAVASVTLPPPRPSPPPHRHEPRWVDVVSTCGAVEFPLLAALMNQPTTSTSTVEFGWCEVGEEYLVRLLAAHHEEAFSVLAANAGVSQAYAWRDRYRRLKRWRGDETLGEARQTSSAALALAGSIADYASRRQTALCVVVPTTVAPLRDGGVHVEWNVRGHLVQHLEIEIPPRAPFALGILATLEHRTGETLSSNELSSAGVHDALRLIEKLLTQASRGRTRQG